MSEQHRTAPDDAIVHASGWAPFSSTLEVTRLPLIDRRRELDDGHPLFARLTYRDALTVAKLFGASLVSREQMIALHTLSIVLAPTTLPAGAEMLSLEYSREHDAHVWPQLEAWDQHAPVAGAGKHWIAGAPPGRAYLMGWWTEHLERYSQTRRGPGWIQEGSTSGPGPHDDQHHDYATTTLLVRPRAADRDTDPAPPGSGWASTALGILTRPAEAAARLMGSLLHGGGSPLPPRPDAQPGGHVMPARPAFDPELPQVTLVDPAKGFRRGRAAPIRLVVLHTAECAETATSAEAVAAYFRTLSSRAASAHFCIDSDSVVQCVRLADTAWAAPGANDSGIQIEMAGYAGQGAAGWADAYSTAMLERVADVVAELCRRFSLPVAYVDEAGLLGGLAGITTHAAVSRAFKRSTHTDPGGSFPLAAFLDSVRGRMG